MSKLFDLFESTALYYNNVNCRRYLQIKRKATHITSPDLLIVMMNPGSAKCEQPEIDDIEIPVNITNTQRRLMKVMYETGYEFARIINLLDIRQKDSQVFYRILKDPQHQLPLSIFDDPELFARYVPQNVPIIIAWGTSHHIKTYAELALEKLKGRKIIGLSKTDNDYAYYHPLVRNPGSKWTAEIIKQLGEKR